MVLAVEPDYAGDPVLEVRVGLVPPALVLNPNKLLASKLEILVHGASPPPQSSYFEIFCRF